MRCVNSRLGTALEVRHAVALKLLQAGELGPEDALMFVVWPPKGSRLEDVPLGRRDYPTELRKEMRRRHDAGETIAELEARTGIAHGTIKLWLTTGAGRKDAEREQTLF